MRMEKPMIEIYLLSDDERSEWEAVQKEYRNDVIVYCNDFFFHLNIYTPLRLTQDFETEIENYGFYAVDGNMILVPDTDRKTVIFTILKLYEEKYFDKIKSSVCEDKEKLVQIY